MQYRYTGFLPPSPETPTLANLQGQWTRNWLTTFFSTNALYAARSCQTRRSSLSSIISKPIFLGCLRCGGTKRMSSPVGGRPARAGIEIDHSSKSSSNNAAHHRPHRMRLLRLLLLRLRRSAADREGRRPARLRAKVRVVRPVVLSHLAPRG